MAKRKNDRRERERDMRDRVGAMFLASRGADHTFGFERFLRNIYIDFRENKFELNPIKTSVFK